MLASWGQRLAQRSTQEKLPDPQGSEWLQQAVSQHWKGHPCKAEDSTDTVLGVVTWLFNNMVWKLGTFTITSVGRTCAAPQLSAREKPKFVLYCFVSFCF